MQKPSCYDRPAFKPVVYSDEFNVSYPFRMYSACPSWRAGGNAHVRPYGDGAKGQRFEWAACDKCRWKDGK